MVDFFRDFIYVLAGLASVLAYKNDGIEQLALVAVAYGFIAIMFQFISRILEKIKIKKLDDLKHAKDVFVVVTSMIIALVVANLLIPIPTPI